MSDTPPPSDRRFKRRDAGSYDPVAAVFDRLSERYTAPIAERVAALAEPGAGRRLLDVATGTGVVALRMAAGGGRVVGVDLARAMLAVARAKSASAGLDADFLPMDAERLAFADGSFDGAASLFGLLHFPRPERALAELHRVVRPGGGVVVAVGSGPPRLTPAGVADGWRRLRARLEERRGRRLEVPRFLDRLVAKELPAGAEPEEAALPRRHRNRAAVVPELLRRAGFRHLRRAWWGEEAEVADAGEFWELQATFSSFARKRLADASPEAVAALRRRFDDACAEVLGRGGELVYPRAALVVTAVRGEG